jgi:hypothetical protein
MIKIFRNIRHRLLAENRFSKYLFYAIGEIALVMVGILLALQVNNWHSKRKQASKELSYLKDIRTNLVDDINTINRVIAFNQQKTSVTDSMFGTLEATTQPSVYMPKVLNYMFTLTGYDAFDPNRTAFNNMVASENVDLISNMELRSKLSQYYKKDFQSTTQESVKMRTRQFGDYVASISFNRQSVRELVGYDSSLKDISVVTIHKDAKVYAYLFSMLMSTTSQTELLHEVRAETEDLIRLIDHEIQ